MSALLSTTPHGPHTAQRNLRLLVAAQSLGGAAPPIIISLGGLVGQMLTSSPALATLPVSLYNLGLALSTLPAAFLMRRIGRRNAYLLGAIFAIFSAGMATWGILQNSFLTFCVGTAMAGFYGACVQSYRFAASDVVSTKERPKAISRIMVGGLVAAIIGPQVVIWTRDLWPTAQFAGSFVSQGVLALLALPFLFMLRLPPAQVEVLIDPTGARPLKTIARTPQFIVAVSAGVVSYGLMAFIMTAAPMAMIHNDFSVSQAALGIQWHVLAMFAPSFFTGLLITKFGKRAVTAAGLLLIAASGVVAFSGLQLWHFWGSLILLGVGWNFGFIGATALITDVYTPAERSKVQSLNDFMVFGTVAIASFGSGQLLQYIGWAYINLYMLGLIAVVVLMLYWPVRPTQFDASSIR